MRSLGRLLGAIGVVMVAACAGVRTELLTVEADSSVRPYANLLVLAVSDQGQVRQVVEQGLVDRLGTTGVKARAASLLMPGALDKKNPDKIRAEAEKVVAQTGVDAVLVTVLLHEDVRQEYVPPRNDVVAVGNVPYFMGYGAFVGYHYEAVHTPGYITEEKDYFVQTMLFDTNTGKSVWKAQSRTVDPGGLAAGVGSFSKAIADRLQKDGLLK